MNPQAPPPAAPELRRVLGLFSIVGIVVGTMIGSGIFINPAKVAKDVGTPALMLAVWIVGGILSFFGALAIAELAAIYSQAGGIYIYLREAYGPLVAFLFGWTLFLVVEAGTIATLVVGFSSKYLPYFVEYLGSPGQGRRGLPHRDPGRRERHRRQEGRLPDELPDEHQVHRPHRHLRRRLHLRQGLDRELPVRGAAPRPRRRALGSFGVALVAALWAYKGWETSTYCAGEIKNPQKKLPLGLFIGSLSVIFLYILANLAYLYVFPASRMAESSRIAADVMEAAVGPVGASVIALIILMSMTGTANGHLLTAPRVFYAMAKDGLFFKSVAKVHPKYRTPYVSIIVLAIWAALLSLSGTFEQLYSYVIFGFWIFMGLTVAGVIILRRKRPDLPRPYKTWGYPVTPILFILFVRLPDGQFPHPDLLELLRRAWP